MNRTILGLWAQGFLIRFLHHHSTYPYSRFLIIVTLIDPFKGTPALGFGIHGLGVWGALSYRLRGSGVLGFRV